MAIRRRYMFVFVAFLVAAFVIAATVPLLAAPNFGVHVSPTTVATQATATSQIASRNLQASASPTSIATAGGASTSAATPVTSTPTSSANFGKSCASSYTSSSGPLGWGCVASPDASTTWNTLLGEAATGPTDIWAVGFYGDDTASDEFPLIEHWNGVAWSVVPSPAAPAGLGRLVAAAAISPTDAWAVGFQWMTNSSMQQTLTEHWDGQQWSIIPSPNPPYPHAVQLNAMAALAADDAWVVGTIDTGDTGSKTFTAHWDGQQWSIIPSPNPNSPSASALRGVTALAPDDVWATGFYTYGDLRTLAIHWDGHQWSVVPSPNVPTVDTDDIFTAVTSTSATDVWAVGWWHEYDFQIQGSVIEHWDGTSWSLLPQTAGEPINTNLFGVAAAGPGAAYAIGTVYPNRMIVEYWNGTSWSIQTIIGSYPYVDDYWVPYAVLVITPLQVWAVGYLGINGQNEIHTLVMRIFGPRA